MKTEVYALSRHINESAGREIIPNEIIEKAPSAELAPNQFDQDSLPPYELMDPILKQYFENKLAPEAIIALGHDAELVYIAFKQSRIFRQTNSNAANFRRH